MELAGGHGFDGRKQAAALPVALEDLVEVAEMDAEQRCGGAQRPTFFAEHGHVAGGWF